MPSKMAYVLFKRGEQFLFSGDYDEALTHLFQSLKIYEDINDFLSLCMVYNSIGVIYDRVQDYDKALEFYFLALDRINKQTSVGTQEGVHLHSIYNNIGNIYLTRKETTTALEYYQKALDMAKYNEDYRIMGVIYNNLGKMYLIQKNFDEAFAFLQNSLKCRQRINDKDGIAKSYYLLGNYYMLIGEDDKALASFQNSLAIGKEVGSLQTQQVAYQFLWQIYERRGKLGEALEIHKLYKGISDSLINQKTIKEITRAKLQFEFDKKEKFRETVQHKRELKYGITISVLTLGFVVIGFLYRSTKSYAKQFKLEKKILEQDLELKSKELTTSAIYLLEKNKLMHDISSRLMALKPSVKKQNLGAIQQILLDIQSGVDQDVWKEFEVRFQQVHKDFYRNLNTSFPDLTPGEIKICAFLRLNMTSKDISAITYQSVSTIEVLRTRIRKKLTLTNKDVNLVSFLSEF